MRLLDLIELYLLDLQKKDLPRGRWRFLEEKEINILKMIGAKPEEKRRK